LTVDLSLLHFTLLGICPLHFIDQHHDSECSSGLYLGGEGVKLIEKFLVSEVDHLLTFGLFGMELRLNELELHELSTEFGIEWLDKAFFIFAIAPIRISKIFHQPLVSGSSALLDIAILDNGKEHVEHESHGYEKPSIDNHATDDEVETFYLVIDRLSFVSDRETDQHVSGIYQSMESPRFTHNAEAEDGKSEEDWHC